MRPAVAAQTEKPLVVFAAASLKNALRAVGNLWEKAGHPAPRIAFAASSALARQIEQGAPADLFISADRAWMDDLDRKGLVRDNARRDLLGNHLVLIAARGDQRSLAIKPGFDLAGALKGGRLAVADTAAVPAGKYAKATLTNLGVWPDVKDKLAQAENVRAALLLVSRGEAPLGIVYSTDAAVDPNVRVVATFPEDSHPPIIYPAAVIKGSGNSQAQAFYEFLATPAARAVFVKAGFAPLPPDPSRPRS